MTHQVIYKCRLCGEAYGNMCTGNKDAVMDVLSHHAYGLPLTREFPSASCIGIQDIHLCKDGSRGIADFQGFKVMEDK